MKVRFVKPAVIIVDGVPQTMFNEGDVQDLNPASAERWRRRGVAVDLAEESVAQPAADKPDGESAAAPVSAAATEVSDSELKGKKRK